MANYCMDCGKIIYPNSKRCDKCSKIGENNPNYKHGKTNNNYCIECGTKITFKSLLCKSCAKKGERHSNWKGGISELNIRIRTLREYYNWRLSVFKRDVFICQICNKRNNLEAHHIKEFHKIIEENNIKTIEDALNCKELWYISNGITFCEECHKEFHNGDKDEQL